MGMWESEELPGSVRYKLGTCKGNDHVITEGTGKEMSLYEDGWAEMY